MAYPLRRQCGDSQTLDWLPHLLFFKGYIKGKALMTAQKIIRVSLTLDEYALVEALALARSTKPNSHKFSNHSEYKIHLMGLVAESAFSKITGIPMQNDIRPGGDGGQDFQVGKKIIQLKTRDCNRYPYPDLMVRPSHAKADYYILSTWSPTAPQTTAFIGYTNHAELTKSTDNFGYGDRYVCKRKWLGDMQIMLDSIKEYLTQSNHKGNK